MPEAQSSWSSLRHPRRCLQPSVAPWCPVHSFLSLPGAELRACAGSPLWAQFLPLVFSELFRDAPGSRNMRLGVQGGGVESARAQRKVRDRWASRPLTPSCGWWVPVLPGHCERLLGKDIGIIPRSEPSGKAPSLVVRTAPALAPLREFLQRL